MLEKNQNALPIQCEIMNRHEHEKSKDNLVHDRVKNESAHTIQKQWKILNTRRICAKIRVYNDKVQSLHHLLKETY